jgi:hypothetical protein
VERQLEEERVELAPGAEARGAGKRGEACDVVGSMARGRDAGSERRCVWWEDSGEVGGLKRENKEVDVSGNGPAAGGGNAKSPCAPVGVARVSLGWARFGRLGQPGRLGVFS